MASAGMELMFNSVKSTLRSPQDGIICVLHWKIISSGFQCIGIGEKAGKNDPEEETEMLPDGWNMTPDLYVLRYRSERGVYVLKVIAVDGTLLVHFWKDREDQRVATMNIRIADFATEDLSSYKKALKHVNDLNKEFKKEILDEMKSTTSPRAGQSRERSNSRERERGGQSRQPRRDDDDDPLRVPGTGNRRPRPTQPWQDPDDPFSIGRGDLDPLRSGGGMLFDPMRGGRGPRFGMDPSAGLPSRLPRGAVPPGARFDPFGPPGTHPGQRPGPDPDHMRPPDYDDMFM
ncbi:proteasome inhibitor PI31 subunit-like [Mya arenaria]|uniref:proteasome inhibitor PI31 subunit-like n=1 Tax=Mya arenaria TaxID=6604 RepID=UPI0022E3263C|nr:proteasome inhibitor PI31 subunit-like [Mya arenaria]